MVDIKKNIPAPGSDICMFVVGIATQGPFLFASEVPSAVVCRGPVFPVHKHVRSERYLQKRIISAVFSPFLSFAIISVSIRLVLAIDFLQILGRSKPHIMTQDVYYYLSR